MQRPRGSPFLTSSCSLAPHSLQATLSEDLGVTASLAREGAALGTPLPRPFTSRAGVDGRLVGRGAVARGPFGTASDAAGSEAEGALNEA